MSEAEQRLNGIREAETEIYCISDEDGDNNGDDEDEGLPGSSHPQFRVLPHVIMFCFDFYCIISLLSHTHKHTQCCSRAHALGLQLISLSSAINQNA